MSTRWRKPSEGVQELLCDSFLQTEIPGSLKYGTFVGEALYYTRHILYTPSNQPEDRHPLRQVEIIAYCRSLVMRNMAVWASVLNEAALL